MAFIGITINKIRHGYDPVTGERGTQMRVNNKTGAATIKGQVYCVSDTTDLSVKKQDDEFDSTCICAESGIADGSDVWVWNIGSICEVLFEDGVSPVREYVAIAATTDGYADNIPVPTSTPSSDVHWKEIGHVMESKTYVATPLTALVWTHYN